MRVLTFTNLYPSAARPRHGIFIEHRVRQLVETGRASVRVVAPTPWAPPIAKRWLGQYAVLRGEVSREARGGVRVWRPRFFAVPKLTSWINPVLMALYAFPTLKRLQREEDFDLIDAHFVYPDGAAAVLLGAWLGKPVAVTARGTDINDFPKYVVPRTWIKWVIRRADALIGVSGGLRAAMLELGALPERVSVMRNGVDLELFTPGAGASLNLEQPELLSVGHLIADKGHQFVIEALVDLRAARLTIVGDGPMRNHLRALAARLGVADRVTWIGTLSQRELRDQYARADATVLASRLEGMPNVLLESIACGTPVIAPNVGGNAEVISNPAAGVLMRERSAEGVAEAVRALAQSNPDREAVRRHAAQFGWGPTAQGLVHLFEKVITARAEQSADVSRAESG